MAAEIICDGCGARAPMESNGHSWYHPSGWYDRSDDDGTQTACSRECVQKIAEKTGKTAVILTL